MNQIRLFIYFMILIPILISCNKKQEDKGVTRDTVITESVVRDTIIQTEKPDGIKNNPIATHSIPDTGFVIMNQFGKDFVFDMKYATSDNFLGKAVYKCDQCLVRKEAADALQKANDAFIKRGYRIKFYDCYRPLSVQKQMWTLFPNASYVANPNTGGSIHNRGAAVDITLVDQNGKELDMGTAFDHFGEEAHHTFTKLKDTVLANRILLKQTMEAYGFKSLSSEWWHYTFISARKYKASDFSVECGGKDL